MSHQQISLHRHRAIGKSQRKRSDRIVTVVVAVSVTVIVFVGLGKERGGEKRNVFVTGQSNFIDM